MVYGINHPAGSLSISNIATENDQLDWIICLHNPVKSPWGIPIYHHIYSYIIIYIHISLLSKLVVPITFPHYSCFPHFFQVHPVVPLCHPAAYCRTFTCRAPDCLPSCSRKLRATNCCSRVSQRSGATTQ